MNRHYALIVEADAAVDDTTIYLAVVGGGTVYARLAIPWHDAGVQLAHRAAASDDLYRELAKYVADCGACSGTGTPTHMSAMLNSRAPDGRCAVCSGARAALAKARGETP